MIRRPPRSTQSRSSAASDVYKRQQGVRFLGTTLWTDFMLFGEGEKRTAAILHAVSLMRDFSRIRAGEAAEAPFTPAASAALFNIQAGWLESKLSEPHAGPTVVITHHAPVSYTHLTLPTIYS